VLVIPLMQYAVMPLLTRAARPFLYPPRPPSPPGARPEPALAPRSAGPGVLRSPGWAGALHLSCRL